MRAGVAALLGCAFGFVLAWAQVTDPDRIRQMLLLEDAYLYLLMASAVAVGLVGSRVLRQLRVSALLTGEPVSWTTSPVERRHIVGSIVFGVGWAISSSCPGPIAAQLGQGIFWSLFTIAGIGIGIELYLRREARMAQRVPAAAPQASA